MKTKRIGLCLLVLAIVIAPVQARNVYRHLVLGGEDTGLSFECIFMVANKVLRQDTLASGAVQFTNTPPDRLYFRGNCDLDEASP